jgi:hypothetical protein
MKWLRSMDGLFSFGIAVFYGIAIHIHFMLPSVPITNLLAADLKAIVAASTGNQPVFPAFCATDPELDTEGLLCDCLRLNTAAGDESSMQCFKTHNGAPAEQTLYNWCNLNFILFHIFFVSFIYQLVIRNALDTDMSKNGRDIQSALAICTGSFCLICVLSVFNFEHGVNAFALIYFMPQQLVLLVSGMMVYHTIFVETLPGQIQSAYKSAMFSGLYKASVMPFVGIFIASLQSWTTLSMIHFIYNVLFCLCVADLAYLMLNVDVNGDLQRVAARIRVKQAVFLLVLTCLFTYTITTVLYMPAHNGFLLRALAIVFLLFLWIQHLLFDATHAVFNSPEYDRVSCVNDAILCVMRFSLFVFSIWVVHGNVIET